MREAGKVKGRERNEKTNRMGRKEGKGVRVGEKGREKVRREESE